MKTFTEYVKEKRRINEEKNLENEYQEVFQELLKKYDAKSPAELSDEKKKEFFDEISDYYKKGEGKTEKGKKLTE